MQTWEEIWEVKIFAVAFAYGYYSFFFIDVIDIHVNCLYMSVTNTKTYATLVTKYVDPLHKWHPYLTDNTQILSLTFI